MEYATNVKAHVTEIPFSNIFPVAEVGMGGERLLHKVLGENTDSYGFCNFWLSSLPVRFRSYFWEILWTNSDRIWNLIDLS